MKRDISNILGVIYKITSPNGKIYIGQTMNFKRRKYYYNSGNFKQQIKLHNNVMYYKWNPCDTIEIIEECLCGVDKILINEREKYWILYYDSFNTGLNCNEGGHGNLGHKHTDESREKMKLSKIGIKHTEARNKKKRELRKGKKHTEESKLKMSIIKKENMNDTTKNKIRIGLMGNQNGIGNKGGSKKVICLNNNIIYDSIKQACDELGLHSGGIINVCKGKYKQTKGYKFKYYEEIKNISI